MIGPRTESPKMLEKKYAMASTISGRTFWVSDASKRFQPKNNSSSMNMSKIVMKSVGHGGAQVKYKNNYHSTNIFI